MELQQNGPVLLKSEFEHFHGKAARPRCFRVCHFLHLCGNLPLRGLDPEGTRDWLLRQPLQNISVSSMSDLAFSSERKNRTHLSRIRPLSRSSLPSSSRTHCCSIFFVSSSCATLMFWKKIYAGLPYATVSPSQQLGARRNERLLLHFSLSSVSCMPSWRPSAAARPCSGGATLCALYQSQPAAQLSFERLHSNLALVSFVPGVGPSLFMTTAANAAFTSSTLLSPGRFALR